MQEQKVIALPSSGEIMARLKKIDMGTDGDVAEEFFPLIAAEAGSKLVAQGIVLVLTFIISDFVAKGHPPATEATLHRYVPEFINALIDDKDVAETAKRFHEEAMQFYPREN